MPARRTICAGKRFIAVMHRDIGWLTAEAERWETRGYDASNERSLIASAETVIEAVHQSLRAIVREERRLAALELALFDPDQPRVPAGNPDGGQWTSGEWEGGTPRAVPVGDGRRLPVNLVDEEAKGGHAIENHVGKTNAELIKNIEDRTYRIGPLTIGKIAEGSFNDIWQANDYVIRLIDSNQSLVDLVANGQIRDGAYMAARIGSQTGYEAYRANPDSDVFIRPTYNVPVIIQYNPSRNSGFRVVTAFPFNEHPNGD